MFSKAIWGAAATDVLGSKRLTWLVIGAMLLLGAIATYAQLARHGDTYSHSVYKLGFGFGELAQHLTQGDGYTGGDYPIPRSAHRLPLIPIFLWAASSVTSELWFAWFLKNLLFFGISGIALALLVRERRLPLIPTAALCAIFFLLPGNVFLLSAIDFEEGYLGHIFLAVFVLLLVQPSRKRSIGLAVLVAAAYLTKSSVMPVLALVAAFHFANSRRKGAQLSWLPAVTLCTAILAWGGFTLYKTGHFAFGATSSSYNGLNFLKGNNDLFDSFYPERNLDYLPKSIIDVQGHPKNEWELDQMRMEEARRWISAHPEEFKRATLERSFVAFVSVQETPAYGPPGLDWEMLFNRILFFAAILYSVYRLILVGRQARWPAILFLSFSVAYAAPYLVAFVYHRHMLPVYLASLLILMDSMKSLPDPSGLRAHASTPEPLPA